MGRFRSSFSPLMIALLALAVVLIVVLLVLDATTGDGPIVLAFLAMGCGIAVVFLSASRNQR